MVDTKVVCVKKKNLLLTGYDNLVEWLKDPNHVYIGRENRFVEGAHNSEWHNPFSVKKFGRDGCIEEFEKFIRGNKELVGKLDELNGKTLGCWCKPQACHGDVIVKLINENKY